MLTSRAELKQPKPIMVTDNQTQPNQLTPTTPATGVAQRGYLASFPRAFRGKRRRVHQHRDFPAARISTLDHVALSHFCQDTPDYNGNLLHSLPDLHQCLS